MSLSEAVGDAGLAVFAEAALLLFFLVFLTIAVRTLWQSAAADLRRAGNLPLESTDSKDDGRPKAGETAEAHSHGR